MSLPTLNDTQQYNMSTLSVEEQILATITKNHLSDLIFDIRKEQPEVVVQLLGDLYVDVQLLRKKYEKRLTNSGGVV